ncbi:LytTR family transcriptional regulator [Acidaminobacter sp. JC074]|uniref:LytTR family DNA-binding domain-containing protein n=1 Tax=Acidaminobacter sp. JC074 TaxID=2530199 RepID=UPI001F0F83D1|nr:LytTR family DNA-binding domain-containing protein [Acidaminobacter sp. JC074]MCH4887129.1 LytTR family transcriptional regulator [Acidaminobacter sp. JC074]
MRVLVFSEDKYVIDTIALCQSEDHDVFVTQVTYSKIKSLGMLGTQDIYVFDYNYMDRVDKGYLDLLKKLQVEVVAYVQKMDHLSFFMGYNMVAYFCGSISLKKMAEYSQEIYSRHSLMKKIKEIHKSDKIISKNKSEAVVLNIDKINYVTRERDLMYYYSDDRTFLSEDHFDKVISMLPEYFVRVDKSTVVNFSKVKEVSKVSSKKFKIWFENGIHHTYATDYPIKTPSEDVVKRHQEAYVIQSIMETSS